MKISRNLYSRSMTGDLILSSSSSSLVSPCHVVSPVCLLIVFPRVVLFIASTALRPTVFMSLLRPSFNLVFGRIFLVCHQYSFHYVRDSSYVHTISVVSLISLDACV